MPYLLILLGILLFGTGIWMLQKPKEASTTAQVEMPAESSPKPKTTTELSSREKGLAFEKFVVGRFNKAYFTLKQWQGDKFHNGRFAEANQHPDLLWEFALKGEKHAFAVECKWKAQLPEEHDWAESRQIENYRQFASEIQVPVFVTLGFGGTPSEPESVYILPLERLTNSQVKKSYLEDFKRQEAGKGYSR
jgi:hypothetical protein